MTARENLQLPCFQALGIASRPPAALLTPPDETTFDLKPILPPSLTSRSSSYPPPNMPKTPSPERSDFAAILDNDLSNTVAPDATQPDIAPINPQETTEEQGTGPTSSSSEDEDVDPAHAAWIVHAIDAVGMLCTHLH